MCLRARKTKRYGQRVPIVSYYIIQFFPAFYSICFVHILAFILVALFVCLFVCYLYYIVSCFWL